ncbi:MAG: TRAP transporter large permease, partial [Desulfobacteraceae bacterium]|nr:TRAP transporter large permease [Desulfobacteraceae bacterium]
MDLTTVAIIGLALLFLLLFLGMPVGFGMALIGFCGAVYVVGIGGGLSIIRTFPYQYSASYIMVVMPLFVLMGEVAYRARLSWDLYFGMNKLLGGVPGSLAMALVGGCAGFAAISGSSLATAATMGSVALPEMKKFKYNPKLAAGCVAAGGSIGILIPPSIILVVYAIMTEESIGMLFMAGILPGILEASLYMTTILVMTRLRPDWAPPLPKPRWGERFAAVRIMWVPGILFVVVIGGIYAGVFTPTEAAAVGAFGSFIVMLVRGEASRRSVIDSVLNAGRTTGMIFAIVIGAMLLNFFLGITKLPMALATFVGGLSVHPIFIVVAILFIYLLLGCIMDPMAMILLTVPIFFPIIMEMGLDPIWFGILIVRVVEIGLITPPIGLNVFIIRGVAKDVPLFDIFQGILPFLAADIVCVTLL